MIIPEEYGGLAPALAHSAVITRLSSRMSPRRSPAMVPNLLSPAGLLQYGRRAEEHCLPRLATAMGSALRAHEPGAGSDATAQRSEGIVCRGTFEGREVLGMRRHWAKRYITLAPAATVLGLAFRLRDPDRLLGGKEDLGITCALLPTRLHGVQIGERHDPLGVPFLNGPTFGTDVFAPVDFIIGGPAMAGKGWRMLMDCLAAGRGISLPSLSVGAAGWQHDDAARAYAAGLPIGRFRESRSRIAGMTYMMTPRASSRPARSYWREAPISAILKRFCRGDALRRDDAMDIRRAPRSARARTSSLRHAIGTGRNHGRGANIITGCHRRRGRDPVPSVRAG
jgi:acyl-CoA dehydrogenase